MTSKRQPNHYLLTAARVFTRQVRAEIRKYGDVQWSAPAKLQAGDVAFLYEMGKTDEVDDIRGRMQIGWLLRATSDAEPDERWRYMATFEGIPLRTPLSLDAAKHASKAFSEGPGRMMIGGNKTLTPTIWQELSQAIANVNPGLGPALTDAAELDRLLHAGTDRRLDPDDSTEANYAEIERAWRFEGALQDDLADLVDQEGWGGPPDPDLGFGDPSLAGYHLPGHGFVDDLLQLGDLEQRHLVVIEYETAAHGDPKHGARQVDRYRSALRERLPDWEIDTAVIAETFNQRELDIAQKYDVECLQAGTGRRHRPTLTQVGEVKGAIWQARAPSRRRQRR